MMAGESQTTDHAIAAATATKHAIESTVGLRVPDADQHAPSINPSVCSQEVLARLAQSDDQRGTILYLAYGSNLSVEKFRGSRGIRPLSQINVQVPTLRLTFDLPGIPFNEPCFANSGRRNPELDRPSRSEKKDVVSGGYHGQDYHKDRWHKGMIGVVYEVTPSDYAHIIATEGGGAGYQDILVDCHPFSSSDPTDSVPQDPQSKPFKAHTLFAPTSSDGRKSPSGGHLSRPDPSYAQPSARYLKLITDGAAELGLPYEYQRYLQSIRPYRLTTIRQRLGQVLLTSIWLPIIMFIFGLGKIFADKHGLLPVWLRKLSAGVFRAVWISYDDFFRPLFGEGERSIPDGGGSGLLMRISRGPFSAQGKLQVSMTEKSSG